MTLLFICCILTCTHQRELVHMSLHCHSFIRLLVSTWQRDDPTAPDRWDESLLWHLRSDIKKVKRLGKLCLTLRPRTLIPPHWPLSVSACLLDHMSVRMYSDKYTQALKLMPVPSHKHTPFTQACDHMTSQSAYGVVIIALLGLCLRSSWWDTNHQMAAVMSERNTFIFSVKCVCPMW